MLTVTKFGGSSLSCESQFKKVKNIVLSDPKRKIVVCSALGKRDSSDSKITDLLYILHAHLKYSVPYDDIWNIIVKRFTDVKAELSLKFDIEGEFDKLKKELNKNISQDYLVSRGEYLTAMLMSEYLGYAFLDAREAITFNFDGSVDYNTTEQKVKSFFAENQKVVVPGFYGAYPNGSVKLLSRGGSDITGSILAKCLNATVYENWTDVSGILMADPRIIDKPLPIKQITYNELRELSYMGANVLHEETIFPVQTLNIPINIRNTNEPDNPGTIITSKCDDESQVITGIAGKKNFLSVCISKSHMSNEVGFLRKVLSIFEKYNLSIEHVPTGIDSVSVIVSEDQINDCIYEIVADLKRDLNPDKVEVVRNIALVAVVGRNMYKRTGLSGKLFGVLGNNGINIKMIAQGPQELNVIVGVDDKDYESTIKTIYEEFVIKGK